MRGFKNNFAQVFSLRSRSAILNICTLCSLPPHHKPPPPPPPKKKKQKKKQKKKTLDSLSICKKKITYILSSWQIIQTEKIGRGVGGRCVWLFSYKLTRNPYLTKDLFFFFYFGGGGGGGGRGRVSVRA